MSALEDLQGIQADLATLTAGVAQVVTDLSVPVEDSVGDQVLAAIIPVLTAAGYTVTAPSDTENTAEDSTDTSTEN